MANQNRFPQSKTNAQEVRQQNAASSRSAGGYQSYQNQSGYNNEFASETNAQEVRQKNQQSMAKKNQQQQQQRP